MKPRLVSYSLRDQLIERDEWCSQCERAKVHCKCGGGKFATLKRTTKEGLGAVRD